MNIYDYLADLSLTILSRRTRRPVSSFQEPDYTAALVTIFPQLLNMFGVRGCRYGGCFIHQKPKVHFNSAVKGGAASCEGGDLLVLLKQTIDGIERYNATLFQLKMHGNNTNVHHIHGLGELVQKELYTDWPQFSIINHGQHLSYDVQPKTITPGAQYMIVKQPKSSKPSIPHYSDTYFYHSIPCNNIRLDRNYILGSFLSKFLNWQTGRPISARSAITEDWSRFIWELINTSKTSVFNRRNVHIQNQPRANGDFFSLNYS